MKTNLTYREAFSKLEELVEQLEEGNIDLEKLSAKVKEANKLIAICETKLRKIDSEIKEALETASTQLPPTNE